MAKAVREKYDEQPAPSLAKKVAQQSTNPSARGRKPAATATATSQHHTTTNGKEAANSLIELNGHTNGHITHNSTNGTSHPSRANSSPWLSAPLDVLHAYRSAHKLKSPSSFSNPHAHCILDNGIGRYSPTMVRSRTRRRVQKEQLAIAVRKHFNALAVTETDVVVNTLYKAKNHDKSLRLKFPALKSK